MILYNLPGVVSVLCVTCWFCSSPKFTRKCALDFPLRGVSSGTEPTGFVLTGSGERIPPPVIEENFIRSDYTIANDHHLSFDCRGFLFKKSGLP